LKLCYTEAVAIRLQNEAVQTTSLTKGERRVEKTRKIFRKKRKSERNEEIMRFKDERSSG